MSFNAKIILDSVNPHNGVRLVTSELTYPRFVHAEFMTHRQFSRNAASSRAIPTRKMLKMVEENPAMPVSWGKNRRGMSASREVDDIMGCKKLWLEARDKALVYAKEMYDLDLHKQIVNRILEPWKWITVIVSTTHTSNFMALRNHEDAQPEIAHLARLWNVALNASEPREREWHLPYIQKDEKSFALDVQQKISVARCARVSYLTHDGVRDVSKDLALYDRLLTGSGHGHWSPFEHVAHATELQGCYFNFATKTYEWGPIQCGNFLGWMQYRKVHQGECQ